MLKGYKTYIIAGLVILNTIAKAKGWIDPATHDTINGVLAGTGLYTLREGVKNNNTNITDNKV